MTILLSDPEKIRRLHVAYFDKEPTEKQTRLYDNFPTSRGISDESQDAETFHGALHLALVQCIPPDGDAENVQSTYLLFPKTCERWVVDQIRSHATEVFGRLREQKRVDAAQFMGRCFQALRLGHLVHQLPGEPERWVSFGFARSAALPVWMSSRLLLLST